ncbi:hypothetical protein XENOCAPTIV_003643, partial [Xenoophorus captivus]
RQEPEPGSGGLDLSAVHQTLVGILSSNFPKTFQNCNKIQNINMHLLEGCVQVPAGRCSGSSCSGPAHASSLQAQHLSPSECSGPVSDWIKSFLQMKADLKASP